MRDRFRKCRACGDWHWTSAWPANHAEPVIERSLLPSPMVIRDALDDLIHPCDSKVYDSKSAFRETTKRYGGIELGNDENTDKRWVDDVKPDEIAVAKQMVDQGYKPAPETATSTEMASVVANAA